MATLRVAFRSERQNPQAEQSVKQGLRCVCPSSRDQAPMWMLPSQPPWAHDSLTNPGLTGPDFFLDRTASWPMPFCFLPLMCSATKCEHCHQNEWPWRGFWLR